MNEIREQSTENNQQKTINTHYAPRITHYARRFWETVRPGRVAYNGAGWGLFLIALVFGAWTFYPAWPTGAGYFFIGFGLIFGLFLLTGLGAMVGLKLLQRTPMFLGWMGVLAGIALFTSFMSIDDDAAVLVTAVGLTAAMLTGAGVRSLAQWGKLTRLHRLMAGAGLAVGLTLLVGGIGLLLWPGAPGERPIDARAGTSSGLAELGVDDPSRPGTHPIHTLTYGSGDNTRRPEFGTEADLITETVNGTWFVSGWEEPRTRLWGFDRASLPLNGTVWYPEGNGPFPLVLMVHGNHEGFDYSDPGYDYLGEHLASHGYIFVSVDENFLNYTALADKLPIADDVLDVVTGDWLFEGSLRSENDARGWLLLKHLETWQNWNETVGNPFFQKVDMGNIGLMGHSRGGEAVAEAAALNRLTHYPDNARIRFNFNFDIRAVVAIAPVDGQYDPAGHSTPVENVNYFTLHGSHDMDVTSFSGQDQYNRVAFTDGGDWFKASLYVYGANHGQFNRTWGQYDRARPGIHLYNLAQLLPPAEQEQVALASITAFLQASLRGQAGYRPFLQDPRWGEGWLPDTIYINQYQASGFVPILTFEEDIDVLTGSRPGTTVIGRSLSVWREDEVDGKRNRETHGVYLGWNSEAANYLITLPDDLALTETSQLVFVLADADENPSPGSDRPDGEPRQPLDFTIELTDANGNRATLPLSHVAPLQPQLEAQLFKWAWLIDRTTKEAVMQSFHFPLADFVPVGDNFDTLQVRSVRFRFDVSPAGVVILDNVGFMP